MAFNLAQTEEEVLKFWKKNKIFEKSLEKKSPKGNFVFYDGPPFATGLPHYGHILGSTVKDVVGRYWTMRGYHVERRWGWDCHGLPIENIVEQQLGINSKKEIEKMGVAKFNEACRAQVLKYVEEWGKVVERIGRWVDFENSYKTMDNSYIESVWWAFKTIWDKGLIYEGKKVLLNCPRCETPIAKAEVAMDNSYQDVEEESVYVKFKIPPSSSPLVKEGEEVYLLAWTTTPWTLPGNVALAVDNKIDYVRVKQGSEMFILAKELAEKVLGEDFEIAEELKGKDLVGTKYEPLYEIEAIAGARGPVHQVVLGDFVTTEEGTGIVHTAVVYGEDDYALGQELGLPLIPLLDSKAIFGNKVPEFLQGVYFKDADILVTEDLKKQGLLHATEKTVHSYPHCHRCGTPLFYNAIDAWFIDIQKIKSKLLKLNKKLNWIPEHFKEGRFQKSVEGAPDWNISRNRYWASAIPVWRCNNSYPTLPTHGGAEGGLPASNSVVNASEGGSCDSMVVIGSVKELEELSGEKIEDLHKHVVDRITFKCSKCGGLMQRTPEVIDSWVEAGSMPFAAVHYPFENKDWLKANFPAQFIAEYTGQVRTWFYYMLVMSQVLFDDIPFENIVVTGTILAEDGAKMSKSKRNFPDPMKIIDKYGVDSLRYYLMTSSVMNAEDINFSEKSIDEVYKKLHLILHNSVKFLLLYKTSPHPLLRKEGSSGDSPLVKGRKEEGSPKPEHVLDKWILAKLYTWIEQVTEAMDAYSTVKATRPILDFVQELSTWYIRRSRDRFKTGGDDKNQAIQTLNFVLLELSKIMAPVMPFAAEHVYKEVGGSLESVHLEDWPDADKKILKQVQDDKVIIKMQQVRQIVELGLAKRDEAKIPVRQPLQRLTVYSIGLDAEEYTELIKDELNVKEVIYEVGDGSVTVELYTELTPELRQEGMKRDLVRQINNLRKKQGLTIQDKVKLSVQTDSEEIKKVLKKFEKEILEGTLATEFADSKDEGQVVKISGSIVCIILSK